MKNVSFILVLAFLVSCVTSKQQNETPSNAFMQLVDSNSFNIHSQWAEPQYTAAFAQVSNLGLFGTDNIGRQIDIRSIKNFLRFRNDSVSARFPFYGERQMGSSSSNLDQGISFDGLAKDLKIEQKGSIYQISFHIKDSKSRSEKYDVIVRINSKLYSNISISSTHRYNIRYKGRVSKKADTSTP